MNADAAGAELESSLPAWPGSVLQLLLAPFPVMCKPSPPAPPPSPTMDNGNGNSHQIGAVNVDFFHGISFGSGAMAVILIVALFYLWLRCKGNADSPSPSNGPPSCNHGACMRPAQSHSIIEMDALNTPRMPEAGGEEAVIRDFLRYARFSNHLSNTPAIEHSTNNPYQMR